MTRVVRGAKMASVVIKIKNRSKHAVEKGGKPIKREGEKLYLIGASSKACVCCKVAGLISKHGVIRVRGNKVTLHDLAKQGDVKVNDDIVKGSARLLAGDRLTIGKLVLEIGIHRKGEPEVKSGLPSDSDAEISAWLMEEDEKERTKRMANPTARAHKVDTTQMKSGPAEVPKELPQQPVLRPETTGEDADKNSATDKDSVTAAEDVLSQKFKEFNLRR
ncbi:MAG: FHA domain-containing protein [Pirellulaceae bacterium]